MSYFAPTYFGALGAELYPRPAPSTGGYFPPSYFGAIRDGLPTATPEVVSGPYWPGSYFGAAGLGGRAAHTRMIPPIEIELATGSVWGSSKDLGILEFTTDRAINPPPEAWEPMETSPSPENFR